MDTLLNVRVCMCACVCLNAFTLVCLDACVCVRVSVPVYVLGYTGVQPSILDTLIQS